MNHVEMTDMDIPNELRTQKAAFASGEKPRATVRELLGWFGAERRGLHVARRIRAALDTTSCTSIRTASATTRWPNSAASASFSTNCSI